MLPLSLGYELLLPYHHEHHFDGDDVHEQDNACRLDHVFEEVLIDVAANRTRLPGMPHDQGVSGTTRSSGNMRRLAWRNSASKNLAIRDAGDVRHAVRTEASGRWGKSTKSVFFFLFPCAHPC